MFCKVSSEGYENEKMLLVGNGPYANKGSEAIVRGTLIILSRRFPNIKCVLSSRGDTLQAEAELETDLRIEHLVEDKQLQRMELRWWLYRILLRCVPSLTDRYIHGRKLRAMRDCLCALEIGGDSYSLEYGSPMWLVKLDQILLSAGKPLVLWGASVGPFTSDPEVEQVMQQHLSRLDLICARETKTVEYLASIGVEENVRLVADPAFVMPGEPADLPDDVRDFVKQRPVGVNFSTLAGRYRKSGRENWLGLSRDGVRLLAASSPILMVPHVHVKGQSDHAFMKEILSGLPEYKDSIVLLPPSYSAAQTKWIISQLRAFVGARTHATIAAMSTGVPTVSIGYSMKAEGINRDVFDHTEWLLPVSKLTPEVLAEKMSEVLSCEDEIRRHLKNRMPIIKNRAFAAVDYLLGVLR